MDPPFTSVPGSGSFFLSLLNSPSSFFKPMSASVISSKEVQFTFSCSDLPVTAPDVVFYILHDMFFSASDGCALPLYSPVLFSLGVASSVPCSFISDLSDFPPSPYIHTSASSLNPLDRKDRTADPGSVEVSSSIAFSADAVLGVCTWV